MQLDIVIGGCCGIHKLHDIDTRKEEFATRARELIRDEWCDYDEDEDDYPKGAIILISTVQTQVSAESYLPSFGFKPLIKEKNTNTGNTVTLWGMNFSAFLKAINY